MLSGSSKCFVARRRSVEGSTAIMICSAPTFSRDCSACHSCDTNIFYAYIYVYVLTSHFAFLSNPAGKLKHVLLWSVFAGCGGVDLFVHHSLVCGCIGRRRRLLHRVLRRSAAHNLSGNNDRRAKMWRWVYISMYHFEQSVLRWVSSVLCEHADR